MILAYGFVKWWKFFSPDQCSGINRFVALFAVPLLSFHFISTNNPYAMNYRFIAVDTLQKIIVLVVLAIWSRTSSRGCLEWSITCNSQDSDLNTKQKYQLLPLIDHEYLHIEHIKIAKMKLETYLLVFSYNKKKNAIRRVWLPSLAALMENIIMQNLFHGFASRGSG